MAARPQGSFAWTDPDTGIRYWGDDAAARMVRHIQGPAVTPQPFDAGLEAARQGAQYQTSLATGESNYQRGLTAYDTGYNADGSFNAGNPYSQAMLLQDSYRKSQAGSKNSYAAMGQYNSGAYQRAKGRDDRNYSIASNQLRDQASRQYHGISYGQLGSYASNSLGVSGADFDALRRALYGG